MRDKDYFGAILFFFFLLIIILAIPNMLKGIPTFIMSNLSTVGIVIGIILCGIFAFSIYRWHLAKVKKLKESNQPCKHNFAGGIEKGCPQCVRERSIIEKKAAKIQSEIELKAYNSDFAKLVYDEEIQKVYLHNCQNIDYLQNKISSRQFEVLIAELFEKQGYQVELTPPTNDGGKDIIVRKGGQTCYVECKQHSNSNVVGRPLLQKLVGAMHGNSEKGFFVTTGTFAATALEYAKAANVELIDQNRLLKLFQQYFPSQRELTNQVACKECGEIVVFKYPSYKAVLMCRNKHDVENNIPEYVDCSLINHQSLKHNDKAKRCDLCGKRMRLINGKYGRFWGCTNYPTCRHTISVTK